MSNALRGRFEFYREKIHQETEQKNYSRVIALCSEFELEVSECGLEIGPIDPFYGIHLLCLLIQNDLNNARFLWKRIPTDLKGGELFLIWKLGKHLWNRNYKEFYSSTKSAPSQYQGLVKALIDSVRARTFTLLSRAYSSISIADCSAFLGLSPEETVAFTLSQGWNQEQQTLFLVPKRQPEDVTQKTGIAQLQQLTEYMVALEQ
eukprot:TRINITY_DN5975_c0_g1_i1.p1 TRINITY_DN5975_c0_g1~~TRINITY_DN5975_c0_g1_i1.p1  ORF type:complete len:217 (-),score=58.05 TRINITY_DN5975_c0_g1_i1:21-635(-)